MKTIWIVTVSDTAKTQHVVISFPGRLSKEAVWTKFDRWRKQAYPIEHPLNNKPLDELGLMGQAVKVRYVL